MPVSRAKKEEIVAKLKEVTKNPSVVFVNFHGLPVKDSSGVRSELRTKGVQYYVAKKTLTKKVFSEGGIEGELPELPGELALVYGDDLLAPAREIYDFQKKYAEKITILGGVFDNTFKTAEEMTAIATIPSEHTLRGMFVNLINSPIQGLVIALDQIAAKQSA